MLVRGCTGYVKPRRKVEGAAFAHFALYQDPALHHLHQPGGNRQTQPSAAVMARGGVISLLECLKDFSEFVRGNANAGITNGKAEKAPIVLLLFRLNDHTQLTLFGKFYGFP